MLGMPIVQSIAKEWLDENYPKNGVCQFQKKEKHEVYNNIGKRRNEITHLDISAIDADGELGNILTGFLDLSDFSELKVLYCGPNKITKLNLNGCTKLENLDCSENYKLTKIIISPFAKLENFWFYHRNFYDPEFVCDYLFALELKQLKDIIFDTDTGNKIIYFKNKRERKLFFEAELGRLYFLSWLKKVFLGTTDKESLIIERIRSFSFPSSGYEKIPNQLKKDLFEKTLNGFKSAEKQKKEELLEIEREEERRLKSIEETPLIEEFKTKYWAEINKQKEELVKLKTTFLNVKENLEFSTSQISKLEKEKEFLRKNNLSLNETKTKNEDKISNLNQSIEDLKISLENENLLISEKNVLISQKEEIIVEESNFINKLIIDNSENVYRIWNLQFINLALNNRVKNLKSEHSTEIKNLKSEHVKELKQKKREIDKQRGEKHWALFGSAVQGFTKDIAGEKWGERLNTVIQVGSGAKLMSEMGEWGYVTWLLMIGVSLALFIPKLYNFLVPAIEKWTGLQLPKLNLKAEVQKKLNEKEKEFEKLLREFNNQSKQQVIQILTPYAVPPSPSEETKKPLPEKKENS